MLLRNKKALRKQRFPKAKKNHLYMMSAPLLKPSLAGKAELDSESPPTSLKETSIK